MLNLIQIHFPFFNTVYKKKISLKLYATNYMYKHVYFIKSKVNITYGKIEFTIKNQVTKEI